MNKKLGVILGVIAGILVVGGGVAYASDSAAPGDILFPVDLAVESVVRTFKSDPVALADFETDVLAERVAELDELSEEGEAGDVESAADYVAEQGDVVKEKSRNMNETCDAENCDEGEKTRVTNRIETQTQEQVKTLEQSKVQAEENLGEAACSGACGKIDDAIEKVSGAGSSDSSGGGNGNN